MNLFNEVIKRHRDNNGDKFLPLDIGIRLMCDVLDERLNEQDQKIEDIINRVIHHIQEDKIKKLTENKF